MKVSIMIDLPVDVYRALIPQANEKGCQVHTLIERAITGTVRNTTPRPAPRSPRKAVVRLDRAQRAELARLYYEEEWSAQRLAEHFGVSRATANNITREERGR